MCFLNWFRGEKSNVEVLPDRVWMTSRAKFAGIADFVQQALASRDSPLAMILVAHFPDCLEQLRKLVDEEFSGSPVMAAGSSDLAAATSMRADLDESQRIDLVVGERHPLLSRDEAIEEFARGLPCRCRISRHVSLEDATMSLFAGEWVQTLLKRLGMKEGEAIESKMVSRRIMQAHEKIQERAWSDEPADSAGHWIERNSPDSR